MDLAGRSVLLTGATGGIGHAIARRLHRAGARLILTGRRTDVLEPLAAELGATAVAVDLSDRAEVDGLIGRCADVDILVANAALPAAGAILDIEPRDIDAAIEVNLRAPIMLARALGEHMVARGSGHMVFISSLSGKSSAPGSGLYSATKFGLRGFAHGLREDLRDRGVGVSIVFPGFISDAGMFASSGATLPRGVGTKTPEQVADGVARAITRNRNEVDVAPLSLALGAMITGVAPELSARVQRRLGSAKISQDIAAGHARAEQAKATRS